MSVVLMLISIGGVGNLATFAIENWESMAACKRAIPVVQHAYEA